MTLALKLSRLLYGTACKIDAVRTLAHRAWRHVGGGGRFLVMFGLIYVAIGYSYTGDRPTEDLRKSLRIPTQVAPLWLWGLVWMAGGLAVVVLGCTQRARAGGFVAAGVVPAGWSSFYLFAWLNGDTTRGPISFLIYLVFTMAVATVAGMIDRNDVDPAAAAPQITSCS